MGYEKLDVHVSVNNRSFRVLRVWNDDNNLFLTNEGLEEGF